MIMQDKIAVRNASCECLEQCYDSTLRLLGNYSRPTFGFQGRIWRHDLQAYWQLFAKRPKIAWKLLRIARFNYLERFDWFECVLDISQDSLEKRFSFTRDDRGGTQGKYCEKAIEPIKQHCSGWSIVKVL